jgi:hypothetical protein
MAVLSQVREGVHSTKYALGEVAGKRATSPDPRRSHPIFHVVGVESCPSERVVGVGGGPRRCGRMRGSLSVVARAQQHDSSDAAHDYRTLAVVAGRQVLRVYFNVGLRRAQNAKTWYESRPEPASRHQQFTHGSDEDRSLSDPCRTRCSKPMSDAPKQFQGLYPSCHTPMRTHSYYTPKSTPSPHPSYHVAAATSVPPTTSEDIAHGTHGPTPSFSTVRFHAQAHTECYPQTRQGPRENER